MSRRCSAIWSDEPRKRCIADIVGTAAYSFLLLKTTGLLDSTSGHRSLAGALDCRRPHLYKRGHRPTTQASARQCPSRRPLPGRRPKLRPLGGWSTTTVLPARFPDSQSSGSSLRGEAAVVPAAVAIEATPNQVDVVRVPSTHFDDLRVVLGLPQQRHPCSGP